MSINRRSVGSTRATPPKPDRAGHRSLCERACAGPPLSGPFEPTKAPTASPLRLTRAMQAGRVLSGIGDNYPFERSDLRERSRAGGAQLSRRAEVRISGVKILPEAREDPLPTQYPESGFAGMPAGRVRKARGKW